MGKNAKQNESRKSKKGKFLLVSRTLLIGAIKATPSCKFGSEKPRRANVRPWAPNANHNRQFNAEDVTYIAKIKVLHEIFCRIYDQNHKIRYRLNGITKEIKGLKRVKRILCRRLLDLNDEESIGVYLEIPDKDTNTAAAMDETIGDVVSTVQSTIPPAPKKKKPEPKPKKESKPQKLPIKSECTEEGKSRIMSVIDGVVADMNGQKENVAV
ncbi:hypothetical protein M3Y99_00305500 [Aphelenchoides fujianensis]|nr:hypothetical protein M3Y99_00305500 [Aphelenchoides fujianensis]